MTQQQLKAFGSKYSFVKTAERYKPISLISNQLNGLINHQSQVFEGFRYKIAVRSELKLKKIAGEKETYSQITHENNLALDQLKMNDNNTQVIIVRKMHSARSLFQILNNNQIGLDISKRQVMKQLALSLHNLHEKTITHNLINLKNIYVGNDSKTKLQIPYFTSIHKVVSTEKEALFSDENYYYAPQVRLNEQFSQAGDIYALGIVFLEIQSEKILRASDDLDQKIVSINSNYFRNLLKKMLSVDHQRRPSAQQIFYYIQQYEDGNNEIVELEQIQNQKQVRIYKRKIFQTEDKQVVLQYIPNEQKEEIQIQIQNGWVMVKRLGNSLKFSIKLNINRYSYVFITKFEESSTNIKEIGGKIHSRQIFQLLKSKQIRIELTQSGAFELFTSHQKWLQIQTNASKQQFQRLGITRTLRQHSSTYKKLFQDFSIQQNRLQLCHPPKYWPKISEQLIINQKYQQALKLCRLCITCFGEYQYQTSGFGCAFETKCLTTDEIVKLYQNTRTQINPYDQIGLIDMLTKNYTANRLFLRENSKRFTKNVAILLSLANIQHNQQNYQSAIDYYNKVLQLKPRLQIAQALKSLCIYKNNGVLKQNFNESLMLDKVNRPTQLSKILDIANRYKSISNLQSQLKSIAGLKATYPLKLVYYIFAGLLQSHGQKELAFQYFTKCKAEDPHNPQIYRSLMDLDRQQEPSGLQYMIDWYQKTTEYKNKYQLKLNQQILKERLNTQKKDKELLEGEHELDTGKFQSAISIFEKYLRKYPQKTFVYYSLAQAYRRAGKYSVSNATMKKYIQYEPFDGKAYLIMGYNYEDLQEPELAFQCFQVSNQLQPSEETCNKLIKYHQQQSNFEQLLKYIQKSINLAPQKQTNYQKKLEFYIQRTNQPKKVDVLISFLTFLRKK